MAQTSIIWETNWSEEGKYPRRRSEELITPKRIPSLTSLPQLCPSDVSPVGTELGIPEKSLQKKTFLAQNEKMIEQ
jgi:hypothetical protein